MKRLSIALAAAGFSLGALAALPAATDPTVVNVPQLPGGFVIGGTINYLQASSTGSDLDYASVNTGTATPFNSSLRNVDPGYNIGFGVNLGYIFPNTGNSVDLSYFHIDTDDDDSVNVSGTGNNITTIYSGVDATDLAVPAITSASSKAEFDIDQVDLTASQFINVGCRLVLDPFAGLRWASVERKLNSTYTGAQTVSSLTSFSAGRATVDEKSDFSGIGPIAGINASYYIGSGFGAVGHFDSALLVGDIDSSTTTTVTTSAAAPVTTVNNFKADDVRRVVPVMDAKLGLDYTMVFNNAQNSDLTFELGYQVSNYFNAVDRLNTSFGSPGVITNRDTNDVGVNGPYFSIVFRA